MGAEAATEKEDLEPIDGTVKYMTNGKGLFWPVRYVGRGRYDNVAVEDFFQETQPALAAISSLNQVLDAGTGASQSQAASPRSLTQRHDNQLLVSGTGVSQSQAASSSFLMQGQDRQPEASSSLKESFLNGGEKEEEEDEHGEEEAEEDKDDAMGSVESMGLESSDPPTMSWKQTLKLLGERQLQKDLEHKENEHMESQQDAEFEAEATSEVAPTEVDSCSSSGCSEDRQPEPENEYWRKAKKRKIEPP